MQRVANGSRSTARQCRPSLPPGAELPGDGNKARGDQAADEASDGEREQQRRGGGPADRGKSLRKGREPRRGLAAAELAAAGLNAEPELDRGGGGRADDDR